MPCLTFYCVSLMSHPCQYLTNNTLCLIQKSNIIFIEPKLYERKIYHNY